MSKRIGCCEKLLENTCYLLILNEIIIYSVGPKTDTVCHGSIPWQKCFKQTVSRSGQIFKPCTFMEYSHIIIQ